MYDSLGQLKTETDTLNGGTTTNYTYDVYGNRTSMTVTGANPSQTSYIYDANNRMTRQTKTIGDIQTIADYAYDNNGNMVSKLMSEIAPETEENPTLSIEETETTDAADNLDSAEAIYYTYDVLNRLTGVTADNGMTASYEYDSQNRRIGKTVNGITTEYIWNGDNVIYESGTTEIRYSYGNGLESITNGTTDHYYLKNGHGDITQLADSTGTIAEDYTYDAFGNQLSDTPTVYNPFRYSGEYFDAETGLIYLRARYYDPSIGRFISEDQHWNIDNMIYGDEQKAIKYAIIDDQKVYFDKGGRVVKTEKYKSDTLLNIKEDASPDEGENIEFIDIHRIPDIKSILQSGNLYVYAVNNPVMHVDPNGKYAVAVVPYVAGAVIIGGIIYFAAEHHKRGTTNKANEGIHQKGQARKKRDSFGGEKGDARRTPRKDKKK